MKAKTFNSTEPQHSSQLEDHVAGPKFDASSSVYSGESRSTARTQPIQLNAVSKFVDAFMLTNLDGHAEVDQIQRVAGKITKYLGHVAHNFDTEHANEIVDCVVENVLSLIPATWSRHIPPANVAVLFQRVLGTFQPKHDIDIGELLQSIVTLVREDVSSNDSLDIRNLTQHMLCEVVKEMIVSMTLADVMSPETMDQLIGMFAEIEWIVAKCVNRTEFIDRVMEHGLANYVDEINAKILGEFAERFVDGLLKVRGK